MLYLTAISIGMGIFILVFCCTIAFVLGCLWMSSGKANKAEEFDERDVYNTPLRKVR